MASVPQPRVLISPVSARKPKPISRRLTSPITPATTAGVTGLVYPSPLESSPSEPNRPPRHMSNGIGASTSKRKPINISSVPLEVDDSDFADADDIASVANVTAQNSVWNFVWAEKARKMDKELSKVKSLEEYRPTAILNYVPKSPSPRPALKSMISAPKPVPETPPSIAPSARTHERRSLLQDVLSSERSSNDRDSFFRTPSPALPTIPTILSSPATTPSPAKAPSPPKTPQSLKKKKSITSFRTVPEKNYGIAIFDLRGVDKEDIRVTFHTDNTIIVSWERWEVENWEEDDCIARRTVERVYHRVIRLAEGTKFRDVHCTINAKEDLVLRYPLVGNNGSRSVESY